MDILTASMTRAQSLGVNIRQEDWQIESVAEMLSGNDCMVVSATGTGKTLCFYLATITLQQKTFIVVCPLLNLIDDQVCRAEAFGIKVVAINMASSQQDAGLVDRILNGQFELVFVSPEWCVPHNKNVQALVQSETFRKRIGGIVIDEAHLVHGWRTFRPHYEYLGLLRSFFPMAPVLAVCDNDTLCTPFYSPVTSDE